MRLSITCLVGCLFAFLLPAVDVTGIWTGQVQGRNGEVQEITFRFRQTGDALTGKMYGDIEDIPLADGKVSGNQIGFSVTNEFGGGRAKFVYTGTVKGTEIELTRDREGGRPGSGTQRQNFRQTLKLKRMLQ
jgi:hypothetical protein